MLRSMKLAIAALASVATFALASTETASAQNWNARPSYGTFRLNAGFLPDPQFLTGRAGGDRHSSAPGCPNGGWFANAPDFRIIYQAGGYPLTVYVRAPGDTMLLINDPAANWYCNDDFDGLDPVIRFANPRSGQYDIWIGTYNRARVQNTRVYVTETR